MKRLKMIGYVLLYLIIVLDLIAAFSVYIRFNPAYSVPFVPLRMFLQMTMRFQVPVLFGLVFSILLFWGKQIYSGMKIHKNTVVLLFMLVVILLLELCCWWRICNTKALKTNLSYSEMIAGTDRDSYQLLLQTVDNAQLSKLDQCEIYEDNSSEYKNTCLIYLNYGGWSVQPEKYGAQIKNFFQKEGYTFVRFAVARNKGENILELARKINDNLNVLLREKSFEHIILCGGSAGGHLALLCAGKNSGDNSFNISGIKVDGVVALYPCVDPGYAYDYYVKSDSKMLAAQTKELDEAVFGLRDSSDSYYEAANIMNAMNKEIPILIVQGDKDSMLPVEGARALYQNFSSRNKKISYLELPGVEHVFDINPSVAWQRCEREMTGFVRSID